MPGRTGPDGGRRPLVDPALANELLAKSEAQGVELLGPDGLLSQGHQGGAGAGAQRGN